MVQVGLSHQPEWREEPPPDTIQMGVSNHRMERGTAPRHNTNGRVQPDRMERNRPQMARRRLVATPICCDIDIKDNLQRYLFFTSSLNQSLYTAFTVVC